MKFVKFLKEVTAKNSFGAHFNKGCVVELAEDSARHWVTRRAAKYVNAPVADKDAPEKAEAEDKGGVEQEAVQEVKKSSKSKK